MRAYFLDAYAATLRAITIDETKFFDEARRLLGCETIDRIWLDPRHAVYFDDDELMQPAPALWTANIEDVPIIAGNSIIVGDDGKGGLCPATHPPEHFSALLRAFRPMIVADFVNGFDPRSFMGITMIAASSIGEFRLTLEERPVTIETQR